MDFIINLIGAISTVDSFWLKYVPSFIRTKLEGHHSFQKIISNTSWLFMDKILRMGLGLFVGVWIARYLGPEKFGLMNYAIAFVALFGPLTTLGLNGIVVRDLVRFPEDRDVTLGTAFVLHVIGSLLAISLIAFTINILRPADGSVKLFVVILGFATIFRSMEVVKYWFESQVKAKYFVLVESGVYLIITVTKILLVLNHAELFWFICTLFFESLLVAIGLLYVYTKRGGKVNAWQVQIERAKDLIKESWPYILSGASIAIYMKIDQVMLAHFLGDNAVGIYSVAAKISELWYFIPLAIVSSVFPSIIKAKSNSEASYLWNMQRLYDIMLAIALSLAIPMTFLSDWLILLLFGADYSGAGEVLALHIWSGVFVFFGIASSRWFLIENLQKLYLKILILGALSNVALNLILIPTYGLLGAASATIISYGISDFLALGLFSKTRKLFISLCKSFLFTSFYRKRIL